MKNELLVSTICLLATFTGAAQERGGDTTRTLEPAYSVYSRKAVSSDEIPAEKIKAVTQVADALLLFSGVQIKDYGGIGGLKTINVRSLGSEHTGVFIDGIQVENAQNCQVDLGRFSTDGLASIRLFNGLRDGEILSAKEYSAASSVHLESGVPIFRNGGKRNLSLRIKGGSFGTFSPSASLERRLSGKTSARVSGEFLHTNGRYRFTEYDTSMVRRNSDLSSFRAEGQVFHHGESDWNAKAYWYDSERGLPGPVVRRPAGAVTSLDRQADRNFFAQGSWRKVSKGSGYWGIESLAKGKYSRDYTRYITDPSNDPQAMPTDNRYTQQAGYLSLSQLFRHSCGFSLNIAEDLQLNHLDANLMNFVYPKRWSSWTAVAGRFNRGGLSISASLSGILAFDTFRKGSEGGGFSKSDKTRRFLIPTFSAIYSTGNHLTFSGFVKRSCRMPSFNDLYYTLVGNSDLEPETAWQFDLGVQRNDLIAGWLSSDAKAEVYHNKVTDKIVAVPTSNQFRWSMYNIGKVSVYGADLKWSLGCRLLGKGRCGVTARYSYQKATDLSSPDFSSYKGQIPYIPLHSGSISADASWNGWRADISWIATGKRWSSSVNLSQFKIDPWSTMDIILSKAFGGVTLKLNLRNVFNEQYEIVRGYPMPGTNFRLSLDYSF